MCVCVRCIDLVRQISVHYVWEIFEPVSDTHSSGVIDNILIEFGRIDFYILSLFTSLQLYSDSSLPHILQVTSIVWNRIWTYGNCQSTYVRMMTHWKKSLLEKQKKVEKNKQIVSTICQIVEWHYLHVIIDLRNE